MKTRAVVTACHTDGSATVRVAREAACEGCHKRAEGGECSVCTLLGGKNEMESRARNAAGANVGDIVEVETESSRVLWYAALVFLFPLLLAVAGYFITRAAWGEPEWLAPVAACGCFAFAFLVIWIYSRTVVARRLDAEIVSVLKTNGGSENRTENQNRTND